MKLSRSYSIFGYFSEEEIKFFHVDFIKDFFTVQLPMIVIKYI
jgi:hypothetical protein